MALPVPLSVLDVVPVVAGASSAQALAHSLDLARLVDRLGYQRLWYAEHHNMPMIASTSPDVLIARAATATARIRLGAGGVMLPNHAPLRVAETYKLLEALAPGRIDLGLGRAPGTDQLTALALRRSRAALAADDFPERLVELLAFGGGEFPAGHPFAAITAYPDDVPLPPVWLLGSSGFSADLAARMGLPFAFAGHFSHDPPEGALLTYRQRFQPGALERPHALLALSVICAETQAEAERLATSMELAWIRLRTGRLAPLPSPEEALAYPYTPADRAVVDAYRHLAIVGTPAHCAERITEVAQRTQADEVMVSTMTFDPAARLRSYELLAAV